MQSKGGVGLPTMQMVIWLARVRQWKGDRDRCFCDRQTLFCLQRKIHRMLQFQKI